MQAIPTVDLNINSALTTLTVSCPLHSAKRQLLKVSIFFIFSVRLSCLLF